MGLVVCAAQRFAGGEGTNGDVALANAQWRGVLRHPQAALSLSGLGGGTLVDAGPTGRADLLHEVVPLVGGGWLTQIRSEVGADFVTLTGEVASLPGRPAWGEGETRSVTWRVLPDTPWVGVEGAEALWIHVAESMTLVDGWLANDRAVVGHDGVWVEDLGGAIVAWGADRLLLSTPGAAWRERPGPLQEVSGTAIGADRVELIAEKTLVGWLPVGEDGAFAASVPQRVDQLVAVAAGRRASGPVDAGANTVLSLGPAGSVVLRVGWPEGTEPRPLDARWTDPDGRAGRVVLPPSGGRLPTGTGPIEVTLDAGPAWFTWSARVEVRDDEAVNRDISLVPERVAPRHVAVDLGWAGSRSRTVRSSAADRMREAVGAGFSYVVTTAHDDVESGAAYVDDVPRVRWDDGATLTSADGWQVEAWPWRATSNRSGHGAPRVDGLSAVEGLRTAWGGSGVARFTRVDLPWMNAVRSAPFTVEPVPDFVRLDGPVRPPFAAWTPWFAWLNAGRFVRPSGPMHWLDVGLVANHGPREIQRALVVGRLAAGTGAWLDVRVDGRAPGGIVPPTDTLVDGDSDDGPSAPDTGTRDTATTSLPGYAVGVSLQTGALPIDRMTVWTEGLGDAITLPVNRPAWSWEGRLELGAWMIVIGWSTVSDDWVVSTPIWTRAPGAEPPAVTP